MEQVLLWLLWVFQPVMLAALFYLIVRIWRTSKQRKHGPTFLNEAEALAQARSGQLSRMDTPLLKGQKGS